MSKDIFDMSVSELIQEWSESIERSDSYGRQYEETQDAPILEAIEQNDAWEQGWRYFLGQELSSRGYAIDLKSKQWKASVQS